MNFLMFLANNWDSVLIIMALIIVAIILIKKGETGVLEKILFGLVTQAEKQFGDGTGAIKLAVVSDWLYQRIPAVLKLLFTAKDIERMIEKVLQESKEKWAKNNKLIENTPAPIVATVVTAETVDTAK